MRNAMNEKKILKKRKRSWKKKIKSIKRGGEEWKVDANRHVLMKITSLHFNMPLPPERTKLV
jgi:hypothetical protein